MAVVIHKEPQGTVLNAYNNSEIEFGLDAGTPARALVNVGGYTFEISPEQGLFHINLKRIISVLVNQNAFSDSIELPLPSNFVIRDDTLYWEIEVTFSVYSSGGDRQTLTKTYRYLKSVQQQVRPMFADSDLLRVLLPSTDNTRHVTYFEGYPFDVSVYSNANRLATVRNVRTGVSTSINLLKGVNRVFLSDGDPYNMGFEHNLPLYEGSNELEFEVDPENVITLFVKKVDSDCGPYVKWFNQSGGWSYWRFKRIYQESGRTKEITTLNNDFYNLEESQSGTISTGKEGEVTITVYTGLMDEHERRVFEEILFSPKVYFYNKPPFQEFRVTDWKEVTVNDGTYETKNTRSPRKDFRLTITMPMIYGQIYAG